MKTHNTKITHFFTTKLVQNLVNSPLSNVRTTKIECLLINRVPSILHSGQSFAGILSGHIINDVIINNKRRQLLAFYCYGSSPGKYNALLTPPTVYNHFMHFVLFSQVTSNRVWENGISLHEGRFWMGIRKNFCIKKVVRHWTRLPRKMVDSHLWRYLRHMDVALSVMDWWCKLAGQVDGWTRWSRRSFSTLRILCFSDWAQDRERMLLLGGINIPGRHFSSKRERNRSKHREIVKIQMVPTCGYNPARQLSVLSQKMCACWGLRPCPVPIGLWRYDDRYVGQGKRLKPGQKKLRLLKAHGLFSFFG